MNQLNPLEICLHEENHSGILKLRIAAATETHLPQFQTELYKPGLFAEYTEIVTEFEKFIRVSFSEIELSEQIGQHNRRLTFDLSLEVVHALPLAEFEKWFNRQIRNKPIAVEITTNNLEAYIFAPMSVSFRYIAPADETSGTRYALDFSMMKREVVKVGAKKDYIDNISVSAETVTINLLPDFSTTIFQKFGFGKSRKLANATLFPENTFDIEEGTFYFFVLHNNGNFDTKKITVQRDDIVGTVRIEVDIIDIIPEDIVRIEVEISDIIVETPITRIEVEVTTLDADEGGGGGGNPIDPIGGTVSKDAYAIPALNRGVTTLHADGRISETLMQLQVFEANNSIFFKDLAADFNFNGDRAYQPEVAYFQGQYPQYVFHNGRYFKSKVPVPVNTPPPNANFWEEVTVTKSYSVGLRKPNGIPEFTLAQGKSGVNIDAYRGSEITVLGQYICDQYPSYVFNWKCQQLYIPEPNFISIYEYKGAKYYEKPPLKSFDKNNWIHRFQDYVRLPNMPSDYIISIQSYNEPERIQRNQYQKASVHSRLSNSSNFSTCFLSDDPFYLLGHPVAYKHTPAQWLAWKNQKLTDHSGLEGFRTAVVNHFVEIFNGISTENGRRRLDCDYIMINNEVGGYWDTDFKGIMKSVYNRLNQLSPTTTIAAWNASILQLNLPDNYQAAFADYQQPNITALKSNAQAFSVAADSSYEWALRGQQIGQYFLGPLFPLMTYQVLAEGMMYEKFLDQSFYKPFATTWRLHESHPYTFPNTQLQRMFKGERLVTFDKIPVSPHLCRNMGGASCYTAKGFDSWDDGKSFTKGPTDFTYPYFNYGPGWKQLHLEGNPADNVHPVNNVDSFVDGAWCMEQNWNMLPYPTQLAEVLHNNLWRSGAEVFPIGAYVTGTPCVLYKKATNGKLWVLAYDCYNRIIKDVQIKIEGVVRTIQIKADKISFLEVN
jgi:hypothetical protein